MSTALFVALRSRKSAQGRRLKRRFFSRIVSRSDEAHAELCDTFAICFRPGDRTDSFVKKALRPLGQSVLVVLSYGYATEKMRRSMPLRGFRALAAPDGTVYYGTGRNAAFRYDAALPPCGRARRDVLDPYQNPSLYELMQRLDDCCERQAHRRFTLPTVPQLPQILLGFAPDDPPEFEDTLALRALAAQELKMPVNRLGSNGKVLLDRLLRQVWDRKLIQPGMVAGVTKGVTHTWRHVFCAFTANRRVSPFKMMKILGHGSLDIVLRYYHVDDDELIDCLNDLPFDEFKKPAEG